MVQSVFVGLMFLWTREPRTPVTTMWVGGAHTGQGDEESAREGQVQVLQAERSEETEWR